MTTIYQTTITKIGSFARDALEDNMFITFKQNVPADLEDYCFVHSHGELAQDIEVGDIFHIDEQKFQITAVGAIANFNLKELGHVTWRFDDNNEAEYPGTIHLAGEIPQNIHVNSILKITKN